MVSRPTLDGNGAQGSRFLRWLYILAFVVLALGSTAVMLLWQNITLRKAEAKQVTFPITRIADDTVDPAEWGKNFPRQFDSYKRTVNIERTKHGGSEAFQKLDADPRWRELFKGYPFSVDYREERGHAYMLSDQDQTERVKRFKQPGSCLQCHASVYTVYLQLGRRAGIPDSNPEGQLMKGFETVCAMPYHEARKLVKHPVACIDCHEPNSMQLRVTRPGFINGIRVLAASGAALPHLASIERWRKGERKTAYDPNKEATRQEMRSFVCGQCHVEYYFKGESKQVTYPWPKGNRVEQIEAYYDDVDWKDWTHPDTRAPLLKAQHPEFELWNTGIHARGGVACADCHMPYKREGAIKVSDHQVRSPLLNISRACQSCHPIAEAEIKGRVEAIQDRTAALLSQAEEATLDLVKTIISARARGVAEEKLKPAVDAHRKAEWRVDFIAAENSTGFHSPQEAARILAEAMDWARKGQVALLQSELPPPLATQNPAATSVGRETSGRQLVH